MSFALDEAINFEDFISPLLGLPVSHIWRGYGSAIFLEFGQLKEGRKRRDGSPGNPVGEWTLMIEWSWRIEGKRLIWCGSWSDEERWPRAFKYLKGATVASAQLFGRLPEVDVGLSNGLHVLSMMTSEGDPEWGLCKRSPTGGLWLSVRAGQLRTQVSEGGRLVKSSRDL
jgi:hypothetical protein